MAPSLFLHNTEVECVEEVVFNPQADYEQVLAEARNYAKRASGGEKSNVSTQPQRSKQNRRTTKVYYVPPPILDDRTDTVKSKWKKKPNRSWKDIFFWRRKSVKQQQEAAHATTTNRNRSRKVSSVSGPLPLYTDGNGDRRQPWHKRWESNNNVNVSSSKAQSGPLKLSAAMSCTTRQDAASPYIPLNSSCTVATRRWSTSASGPLYVTS